METQKVLWLGTAISRYHHLDEQIIQMLSGKADFGELELNSLYVWPLAQLFLPDDDPNKKKHPSLKQREEILQYIAEEKPAYLVIQSTLNYYQDDPELMPEVIEKLAQAMEPHGGEIIFYETGWPPAEQLEEATQIQEELAQRLDATIVPCWRAQEEFRQQLPELDWTYEGDRRHPGKYFIYLNKLVFYKTLIGGDLEAVPTTYTYRDTSKADGEKKAEDVQFTLPEDQAEDIRQVVRSMPY